MSISHRGEVSIEFMFFVGIIVLFFTFFLGIVGMKTNDVNDSTMFYEAQSLSDRIADEINIATRFDGYYREFNLPSKIMNSYDYTVLFHNDIRMVEVRWGEDFSVLSTIMTGNVTGSVHAGKNSLKNENGVIVFEG